MQQSAIPCVECKKIIHTKLEVRKDITHSNYAAISHACFLQQKNYTQKTRSPKTVHTVIMQQSAMLSFHSKITIQQYSTR